MKKNYSLVLLAFMAFFAINVQGQVKVKSKPNFQKFFCNSLMPAKNGLSKDTSSSRAMADNYYLWDNGKALTVKFISGGSPVLREKIKKAAKEWEKYANLTLDFVDYGEANIRVLLTDKGGCNSFVGTVALSINPEEKTMNIDTNFFHAKGVCYDNYLTQTIQHEFGHAIGLLHEHSYKGKMLWNKTAVYKDGAKVGWDSAQVNYQIFQEYDALYTNGFKYDPLSIMHYGFNASWTTNNVEVKSNFKISEGDKESIGYYYPKTAQRANEFPRFVVSNYSPTKVIKNVERKGLLIYPSFNLKTAGRDGKIIITAYIVTTDLKFVKNKVNPDNVVGTSKGGNLKPGLNMNINKLTNDLELYIPYSDFSENLSQYKVYLRVILYDELTKEVKNLGGDIVSYNSFK